VGFKPLLVSILLQLCCQAVELSSRILFVQEKYKGGKKAEAWSCPLASVYCLYHSLSVLNAFEVWRKKFPYFIFFTSSYFAVTFFANRLLWIVDKSDWMIQRRVLTENRLRWPWLKQYICLLYVIHMCTILVSKYGEGRFNWPSNLLTLNVCLSDRLQIMSF
jgi:hypothetical protein